MRITMPCWSDCQDLKCHNDPAILGNISQIPTCSNIFIHTCQHVPRMRMQGVQTHCLSDSSISWLYGFEWCCIMLSISLYTYTYIYIHICRYDAYLTYTYTYVYYLNEHVDMLLRWFSNSTIQKNSKHDASWLQAIHVRLTTRPLSEDAAMGSCGLKHLVPRCQRGLPLVP